jgi:hypothetical protein
METSLTHPLCLFRLSVGVFGVCFDSTQLDDVYAQLDQLHSAVSAQREAGSQQSSHSSSSSSNKEKRRRKQQQHTRDPRAQLELALTEQFLLDLLPAYCEQ